MGPESGQGNRGAGSVPRILNYPHATACCGGTRHMALEHGTMDHLSQRGRQMERLIRETAIVGAASIHLPDYAVQHRAG